MEIEQKLRPDLWKAIEAHFERQDFTESVRDALFYVCEFLREISGLDNTDGTKLVETTLLGKNPIIQINKNETTTEKDIQQGIGFVLKGLMMSSRNPLSHEKTTYSQDEAEAIILFTNYVLNQIDHSGGYTKIDNVTSLLYDDDFTPTAEYAELLLKEIPAKKRYDLLIELFNNRQNLHQHILSNFIKSLHDSLSKAGKTDFINFLNKSLLLCKNDQNLRMYLHYFMSFTYTDLDKLVQLRIESFIEKAVIAGEIDYEVNPITEEEEENCSRNSTLATWVTGLSKIKLLSNADRIKSELMKKIASGNAHKEKFALKYFSAFIFENIVEMSPDDISTINRRLLAGDEDLYYYLVDKLVFESDPKYAELFGEAFDKCEKKIHGTEEITESAPAFPF